MARQGEGWEEVQFASVARPTDTQEGQIDGDRRRRGTEPSALADAIRAVHAGRRAIDPELAAEAWGEADLLTDREREVLRLAGEGLANAEIAARLHLSDGTVRNYLSEAIGKLGVTNRIAAARLARDRGWL